MRATGNISVFPFCRYEERYCLQTCHKNRMNALDGNLKNSSIF